MVLGEFKERSEWHLGTCEAIKKSICDPLQQLKEQQKKEHKTLQTPVEKAHKKLVDFLAIVSKVRFPLQVNSLYVISPCAFSPAEQALGIRKEQRCRSSDRRC